MMNTASPPVLNDVPKAEEKKDNLPEINGKQLDDDEAKERAWNSIAEEKKDDCPEVDDKKLDVEEAKDKAWNNVTDIDQV